MRNFTFFIYFFTIVAILVDLLSIHIIQHQDKFDILVKLGIFDGYNHKNLTSFAAFILVLSMVTCVLLIISFGLIIRRLTTSFKTKF